MAWFLADCTIVVFVSVHWKLPFNLLEDVFNFILSIIFLDSRLNSIISYFPTSCFVFRQSCSYKRFFPRAPLPPPNIYEKVSITRIVEFFSFAWFSNFSLYINCSVIIYEFKTVKYNFYFRACGKGPDYYTSKNIMDKSKMYRQQVDRCILWLAGLLLLFEEICWIISISFHLFFVNLSCFEVSKNMFKNPFEMC